MQVHCRNCGHAGAPRIRRTDRIHAAIAAVLIVCGFVFWPLLVGGVIWLLVAAFLPPKKNCLHCNSDDIAGTAR